MIISSSSQLKAFREGGKILVSLTNKLKEAVKPGGNAASLNLLAKKISEEAGVRTAFEGYQGFSGALCISINDEVAHGVPSEDKIFKEGDIVSLDFGIVYKDFYTDYAITFSLGEVDIEKEALIEVTQKALEVGIREAKAGVRTGDIGFAIEQFVQKKGRYGVVKRLVGHGIGYDLHEAPQIPNFGFPGMGYKLSEGEVIAIEPMITLGSGDIKIASDEQTYKTADGSLAAHFEKTMVVTPDGVEVVT